MSICDLQAIDVHGHYGQRARIDHAEIPDGDKRKILCENAVELFNLEPSAGSFCRSEFVYPAGIPQDGVQSTGTSTATSTPKSIVPTAPDPDQQ